jgi:hypothetical protein
VRGNKEGAVNELPSSSPGTLSFLGSASSLVSH